MLIVAFKLLMQQLLDLAVFPFFISQYISYRQFLGLLRRDIISVNYMLVLVIFCFKILFLAP